MEKELKQELVEVNKELMEREKQKQDETAPGLTRAIRNLKSRRREIVKQLVELERKRKEEEEKNEKNNGQ